MMARGRVWEEERRGKIEWKRCEMGEGDWIAPVERRDELE